MKIIEDYDINFLKLFSDFPSGKRDGYFYLRTHIHKNDTKIETSVYQDYFPILLAESFYDHAKADDQFKAALLQAVNFLIERE